MQHHPIRRPAFLASVLLAAALPAQGLLRDLNVQPPVVNPDSSPQPLPMSNGSSGGTMVAAEDREHGRELWLVLTSGATLSFLADLNPAGDSDPAEFVLISSNTGLKRLFVATHPGAGRELWHDDNQLGYTPLADINPGTASSNPRELTPLTNQLIVLTADGGPALGRELYLCTFNGPTLLADIRPGPLDSDPQGLFAFDGRVWFSADDGVSGRELWVTDGTVAGTRLVADVNPGSPASDPEGIQGVTLQGAPRVFFAATAAASGRELWKSDGTVAGTTLFANIRAGSNSSNPHELKAVTSGSPAIPGGLVFAADDGTSGVEPWVLDGQNGTVSRLADVNPGAASSQPREFTQGNPGAASVVFSAEGPGVGRELFRMATTGAVALVADLMPGAAGSNPRHLAGGRGGDQRVLCAATVPGLGEELAVVDSTGQNVQTFDLNPGPASSSPDSFAHQFGSLRLFAATNGSVAPGVGRELWTLTGGNPVLVGDLRPPEPRGSDPEPGVVLGGRAFFPADDGVRGFELWTSDGTSGGTFLLLDIAPGLPSSAPTGFVLAGNRFYFTANDGTTGRELWTSDGTAAGTVRVADLNPGAASSNPGAFAFSGTRLYFTATTPATGRELFVYNGTSVVPLEVQQGPTGSNANRVHPTASGAVFTANGGSAIGIELYAVTASNPPVLVADLQPGAGGSTPDDFITGNGIVFFTADDGVSGRELWRTGGTAANTQRIADIQGGPTGSAPRNFAALPGGVVFTADNGVSGREPWISTGTAAGTRLVADIAPGPLSSGAGAFTAVDDFVLFLATDDSAGLELWRTDLSAAGTTRVLDLFPGTGPAMPLQFTVLRRAGIGNVVVFAANDGNGSGLEPWCSDGTAAGTVRIADVYAGAGSSEPVVLATLADRLLIAATTSAAGRELHQLKFEAAFAGNARTYGTGCANGTVPVLTFSGSTSPGSTAFVNVLRAAPSSFAFLVVGFVPANQPLPGGCTQLIAQPFLGTLTTLTNALGSGLVALAIPAGPAFLGAFVYWQAVVVHPGGPLFGGMDTSNGLELLIGR